MGEDEENVVDMDDAESPPTNGAGMIGIDEEGVRAPDPKPTQTAMRK